MKAIKMKTPLYVILLFFLFSLSAQGQERKETLNLGDFDEVHLGTSGKVFIKQGNKTEVILQASERRKERLEIEVRGHKLHIGNKRGWSWKGWNSDEDLTVYVTVKEIDALKVSSSGKIIGQGILRTNDLNLAVSGSGRIDIETEAGDIESAISGSGRIEVTGKSEYNSVRISGSGKLIAEDLVGEEYDIAVSGSGNCKINVSKRIEARISGSGKVYYRGNPDRVNSSVSGSGSVRKI
ncbi:head GIN domain-containing protein [Fulvivirgaceae bacterium BMA12]|uniref:Head GIN domain-containing protein n=1 Tax=Agaribacillus aureus TaxID=3051825 RepID=A0ABT8L9F2_9BACT|nr:head GIN domain-containing protein [Fulvivirgaceae bacterium BMA12]